MFDMISKKYDLINDLISFYTHKFAKTKAIKSLEIPNGAKVLDLCCGSGDLGRIAKKINKSIEVIGVDFSSEMLKIAQKKNRNITYFNQDATNLSFEDETFDYVVMGFGLRNIENQDKALEEIKRVLKRDGKFLHLDFNNKSFLNKLYDKIILFLLKIFLKEIEPYLYLIDSKHDLYNNKELIKNFKDVGFKHIFDKEILFKMIAFQIVQKETL